MDKDPAYHTNIYIEGGHFLKETTFPTTTPLSSPQRQLSKLSTLQHSHICPIYSVTPTASHTLQCRLQLLPYSLAYIADSYTASPWDERRLICQFLALVDLLARLQSQNIAHMRISLDHLMVDADLSVMQLVSFACNDQIISANHEERFREDVHALGMCFLAITYIGQDIKVGLEQAVGVALAGLKPYSHLMRVLSRALGTENTQKPDAITLIREFCSLSLCTECAFCQNRLHTWRQTIECYPKMITSPTRFCEKCNRPLDKIRDEQTTICTLCIVKGSTASPKPVPRKKTNTTHSKCRSCGHLYDPRSSFREGFCSEQCKYDYGNPLTHSQSRCKNCSTALTQEPSRFASNGNFCSEDCCMNYAMKLSHMEKA